MSTASHEFSVKEAISAVARDVSFAVEFGELEPENMEALVEYALGQLVSFLPNGEGPKPQAESICGYSVMVGAAIQAGLMRSFDLVENERYFG